MNIISLRKLVITLLFSFLLSSPNELHATPVEEGRIEIKGNSLLSYRYLKNRIRRWPNRGSIRDAERLQRALIKVYKKAGYSYARAWVDTEHNSKGPSYSVIIDEGKIDHISFVGAGTIRTLVLRVELYLPHDVFHAPTMRRILRRIKKRYHLLRVSYEVSNQPDQREHFGLRVNRRELQIYLASKELNGWGVGLSLSSTYGIVPHVSFRTRHVLHHSDHFFSRVGLSFPYRQYLFNESPEFTWVHGYLRGTYAFAKLFRKHLIPAIEGGYSISSLQRVDLNPAIDRYLINRGLVGLRLDLKIARFLSFELAVGYLNTHLWNIELVNDASHDYDKQTIHALALRAFAHITIGNKRLRQDHRSYLRVGTRFEYARDQEFYANEAKLRLVNCILGRHCLIFESAAMYLDGDVFYWSERPLGDFIRVFFDNRFWVQEAVSTSIAFRLGLSRSVKLGIFGQGAFFGDRRDPNDLHRAFAVAFGPSAHFFIFDNFALDIYYGFGFAPDGFDHNLVLSLEKVF